MTEVLYKLASYITGHAFVRHALIVTVLVALCASLLGVTLVLKRFSFIGDGLSHVAFGAAAVAAALNLTNNMLLVLPFTVMCAILLLRVGRHSKIKGDAALALCSVSALGIGYLIMNRFSVSSNVSGDVCSSLFGSTSILTLSAGDVWLCAALSFAVIAVFLLFYHKIFAVTFDEDFAVAAGVPAKTYNLILAVATAVVIVFAMRLVGALLVSALVVFPALSAMRVFKSFKSVTVCSVVVAVVCAVFGILFSIAAGTPVGSTIVAVDIAGFLVLGATGFIVRRFRPS
ncbi:MAG: metal ABC transporter permease [Oscillospiraceae bacterium]|jgi:zinc transport system permease protein|nr:metal ABC transporter permease [Oscillospiraceae bacterium]